MQVIQRDQLYVRGWVKKASKGIIKLQLILGASIEANILAEEIDTVRISLSTLEKAGAVINIVEASLTLGDKVLPLKKLESGSMGENNI